MSLSTPFIQRPVATTLLTLGIALAGLLAFRLLPVAPLPQVDFPTISVSASLPGANPETMAATVATPLERALGRIAGVTEMTSSSSLGSTRVTLQFDLSRSIDGAARDVQAAINAARGLLPTGLPNNPTYRKVNPADAPIVILALTSTTLDRGRLFDAASTILAQSLAQVEGVGEVDVGGSSLPAVRVELDPPTLNRLGVSTEAVRTAIASANVNRPKGSLEDDTRRWQIAANDQALHAIDYLPLVVAYHDGAAVRLRDVAAVNDAVQDLRTMGLADGRPAVLLILRRQPGANVIATVDRVKALLPELQSSIPQAIDLRLVSDSTTTIRASLREVERTLCIAVALVILVVFLFLRRWRAALIPAGAVPVALIGTFGVMYFAGYSLDNLSLMALTVATGFVVDDAVVVLENISRHLEAGIHPVDAALQGAREVGFTVVSMSISLVAVFVPILLMGGIIGRLLHEFAITLSAAILVSLVVSLTTTPMMCACLLRPEAESPQPGRISRTIERGFARLHRGYETTLAWALRHRRTTLVALLATVAANVVLYLIVPKGFMPQQDTGRLVGSLQADQSISFEAMKQKLTRFDGILRADPAVDHVVAFTGGGQSNSANFFIILKPLTERRTPADQVVARLRRQLSHEPGANLFLQAAQDVRVGGRAANAQYQYTLSGDVLAELREWEPKIVQALRQIPEIVDLNTDQQVNGQQTSLVIDRDRAAQLGVNLSDLDATLNDLYGQRLVSTIYHPLNQYRVVMEAAPRYLQSPEELKETYVFSSKGAVPLSAFAQWRPTTTPLAVNHQGQFVATTISFNLAPGASLSAASQRVTDAVARLGVPSSIHGSFQGTAQAFQASLANQPLLILAALVTVYLVLGILYESLVHPLTILSTLPSAGGGAILALLLTGTDFSIIALIGVILLIGIVKKNAILMIDFALEEQRGKGLSPEVAIFQASLLRFRPILMTTMAALLGAVPLAWGTGDGAELRQPLGISIVGGLFVSQLLTLYTTPVVYLYLDQFGAWASRRWRARRPMDLSNPVPHSLP